MILIASPAFAADAAKPAPAEAPKPPADMAERMTLATKFHQVRPLRPQVDLTLDNLGKNMNPTVQAQYKKDIRAAFDYKKVEDASIKAMAETFTPAELKAMIAYYEDPAGKSAAAKMGDYEKKLSPVVEGAVNAAFLEMNYPKKP